ncbi:membrane protein YdbS with pleckstrin-like domain [Bacteroides reticulotermitis]|uniref:Membrane protein YdbS with pleckstrin-like domain n=1 Tax=Bacteroides reticulotermitis TaxID=1133319 RepID=A0A840D994_9BACE|nr:membrane protein YdbS with pleckstrin-like domain [Bacteroides reticulotermitis]
MWKVIDEVSWALALLYILAAGFLTRNYPQYTNCMKVILIALVLMLIILFTIKLCKGIKTKQWRYVITTACLLVLYFLCF